MKDLTGLEYLGKIYINKGLWDKAYMSFKKYLTWINENNLTQDNLSEIYYLCGNCAAKINKFTEARDWYTKSIELFSDIKSYFALGLLYEKLGLYVQEEEILSKLLKLVKKDVRNKIEISSIYEHLAFALFNRKEEVKALGYLAIAAVQFPDTSFLDKIQFCEKYWRESDN